MFPNIWGAIRYPITGVLPFALDILAKTPTCQGDEIGRVVELIAWIPKKAAPRMTRWDLYKVGTAVMTPQMNQYAVFIYAVYRCLQMFDTCLQISILCSRWQLCSKISQSMNICSTPK